MIGRLIRWLRVRRVQPAASLRGLRSLLTDARRNRVQRVAEREGLGPDELDDALTVLAQEHPLTAVEALDLVDHRGLEQTTADLEGLRRG